MKNIKELEDLFILEEETVIPTEAQKNALFSEVCDILGPCESHHQLQNLSLIERKLDFLLWESQKSKLQPQELKSTPLFLADAPLIPLEKIANPTTRKLIQNWINRQSNKEIEPVSGLQFYNDIPYIMCRLRVDDSPYRVEFAAWKFSMLEPIVLYFHKLVDKSSLGFKDYSQSIFESFNQYGHEQNPFVLQDCDILGPCINPHEPLLKPLIEPKKCSSLGESRKRKLRLSDIESKKQDARSGQFAERKLEEENLNSSSNQLDEAISEEELFLDTFQKTLAQKFRILRKMADNHDVKVNVDKLIDKVMTEVTRQVSDNFDQHKGRAFRNHLYVLLDLDESVNESFKKNFHRWCEDFVETLNKFKKMAPWMDMKAVAKQVLTLKTEDFDYLWAEWPGKGEKNSGKFDKVSKKYTLDGSLSEYSPLLSGTLNAKKEDVWTDLQKPTKSKLRKPFLGSLSMKRRALGSLAEMSGTKIPWSGLSSAYMSREFRQSLRDRLRSFPRLSKETKDKFFLWFQKIDPSNLEQVDDWVRNSGALRLRVDDSKFRIKIFVTVNKGQTVFNSCEVYEKPENSSKPLSHSSFQESVFFHPDVCKLIEASKTDKMLFVFGKEHLSDIQHTYLGNDPDAYLVGKFRTGHAYTTLNHRINFYAERYGQPDFIHVISWPKRNSISAVYAEHGNEMVRLWTYVDVRQEPAWREFEFQANQAGYSIKDFYKGNTGSSQGFWLDSVRESRSYDIKESICKPSSFTKTQRSPRLLNFLLSVMESKISPGSFAILKEYLVSSQATALRNRKSLNHVCESKKKIKKLPKRKKELLDNWKKLVNMGPKAIQRFLDSEEGQEAGLGRDEASRLKIRRGRDSARAIIRMKKKGWRNWTPADWRWAGRQVSFISRMKGNPGALYKDGKKTPKHLALLVWGHNPKK